MTDAEMELMRLACAKAWREGHEQGVRVQRADEYGTAAEMEAAFAAEVNPYEPAEPLAKPDHLPDENPGISGLGIVR